MTGTTSGGRRVRARGAIRALVLGILVFAGSLARAEDRDTVLRRMEDRYYFVDSLGRGWEPLLTDLSGSAAAAAEDERRDVFALRDRAAETYAGIRLRDGSEAGENRALELYDLLSREAVDEERRPAHARSAAEIEVLWAGRAVEANEEDRALELAESAAARSPGFEPAYGIIAAVALKRAARAEESEDYVEALAALTRATERLPETSSSRERPAAERDRILRETGEVAVEWYGTEERLAQVQGPKLELAAAKIRFGGAAGTRSVDVSKPIRIRIGSYAVAAVGEPAGASAFELSPLELTSAGGTIRLPVAVPEGMLLVPPVGDEGAFFVDRTEVPADAFEKVVGRETEFRKDDEKDGVKRPPARGVTIALAKEYAEKSGKEIPTKAQWFIAAYGTTAPGKSDWPWGSEAPQLQKQFYSHESYGHPDDVGTRAEFPSRFGCLNMAGNVWEWIRDDRGWWIVGGAYDQSEPWKYQVNRPGGDAGYWDADMTKNPAPSAELYEERSRSDRAEDVRFRQDYDGYRVTKSTLPKIGLRCVVSLGLPRRKP